MPRTNLPEIPNKVIGMDPMDGTPTFFAFITCFTCNVGSWVHVQTNEVDRILCYECDRKVQQHDG